MHVRSPWLDRMAIGLSGLCLVHCLAGALLLVAVSTTGGLFFSHRIHAIGLLVAIPLAATALARGVLSHRRWAVGLLGLAGLVSMTLALVYGHRANETVLTMTGVSLLALAHLWNLRAHA